jgi:hypothetical protein
MKNGKIYDGNSLALISDSFKGSYAEMCAKRGIQDSNTIASGGMYLEQQLREVLPEVLSEIYPEMPLLKFLSVDNSGALSQSIIQRAQSFEGRHTARHESANTTGTISVNRTAREQIVMEYEGESDYSQTDLQRAILLNEGLDTSLIEGHNLSYMKLIDEIGFNGISIEGETLTEGLTNYSNVISALNIDASQTFANATGIQMYQTIARLYNLMVGQAKGSAELVPNVLVLPPQQFSDMSTALMTGTSPVTGYTTVKEFIESKLGLTIYSSARLIGAGDGATDRAIMLNNDRRNIRFHLPEPLNFAPVFIKGFKYMLASKFRVAGVGINRSNAIGYIDGI